MGAAMKNGKDECVGGIVMMLRGENSRDVVRRVAEKVKEINENNVLPEGIKIVPYYDRSDIVKASVGTVNKALIEGSILVLIVLYLLLNSIRGSIVVLIALPLSLLATFIVMKLAGISANLMSLGGLAISIGMIIDTTIIQVENVQRHLSEEGGQHPKLLTVLKAVMEVRKPSIFGELIIALTFIPILSLEGIEGKMFGPLAITVAIALACLAVPFDIRHSGPLHHVPETAPGKRELHHEARQQALFADARLCHEHEAGGVECCGGSPGCFTLSGNDAWERNSSRSWMKAHLIWMSPCSPAFPWPRPWKSTSWPQQS